jgi:uncharacterized membrane protein
VNNPAMLRPLSAWAALTGLALIALLAIQLLAGGQIGERLPMLLAAVVGFELFLFGRDLLRRVRRRG